MTATDKPIPLILRHSKFLNFAIFTLAVITTCALLCNGLYQDQRLSNRINDKLKKNYADFCLLHLKNRQPGHFPDDAGSMTALAATLREYGENFRDRQMLIQTNWELEFDSIIKSLRLHEEKNYGKKFFREGTYYPYSQRRTHLIELSDKAHTLFEELLKRSSQEQSQKTFRSNILKINELQKAISYPTSHIEIPDVVRFRKQCEILKKQFNEEITRQWEISKQLFELANQLDREATQMRNSPKERLLNALIHGLGCIFIAFFSVCLILLTQTANKLYKELNNPNHNQEKING